ncbi:DUF6207 family protein [Streptomyces iconiensis]|uniref:DUF6207 family protein n=1 Tax=Streptomyces iconiensis TaxID=1384038 RepID=UPI003D2F58C3
MALISGLSVPPEPAPPGPSVRQGKVVMPTPRADVHDDQPRFRYMFISDQPLADHARRDPGRPGVRLRAYLDLRRRDACRLGAVGKAQTWGTRAPDTRLPSRLPRSTRSRFRVDALPTGLNRCFRVGW